MDTGAAAGQHGAGGVPDRGAGVGAGLCGPCGRDAHPERRRTAAVAGGAVHRVLPGGCKGKTPTAGTER